MMCTFRFEDVIYKVSQEAYVQLGDIRLPDGRVLRPGEWLESYPPKPSGLVVISRMRRMFDKRPVFEARAV